MKKILIVLSFLLLTVLVSCADEYQSDTYNISSKVKTDLPTNGYAYQNEKTTIVREEIVFQTNEDENSTTALNSESMIQKSFGTDNENSAPEILFLTLEDIATIENAFQNMDENEFEKFIAAHPKHYAANGIRSRTDAKVILDELKETTVILIDNNTDNVSEMYFYSERNEIQQTVLLENGKRIICTYYTPKNSQHTGFSLGNNEETALIDEMIVDGISAKIYRIKNNDSYFVELNVNNTAVLCRVVNMETVDELILCFNRLTFVKIGDLLNE